MAAVQLPIYPIFSIGASPWTSKHVGERVDSGAKYNDREFSLPMSPPSAAFRKCEGGSVKTEVG